MIHPTHSEGRGGKPVSEDAWYAALLDRFPEGAPMTRDQFRALTLESATLNDDGICWPPHLSDFFTFHSCLLGMFMDGLIRRKHFRADEPILPYLITDKGREFLNTHPHP